MSSLHISVLPSLGSGGEWQGKGPQIPMLCMGACAQGSFRLIAWVFRVCKLRFVLGLFTIGGAEEFLCREQGETAPGSI